MKFKIITFVICAIMCATGFIGMAGKPVNDVRGTPETGWARVSPAVDGTHPVLVGNIPNAISYFWEQGEAFQPSVTVATIGTNTKGIALDGAGNWVYNTLYGYGNTDFGSIWDAWAIFENAVQVYEVFNDQSVSGRNYTCIFEDQIEGDGGTNFGANNAQNAMTVINDPTLVGTWAGNSTAMISIANQITGYETTSLWDGYRVFKSTAGPITQTNQGTALGDATLENGVWVYRDTAFVTDSWYAVKVKWDGSSTGTFFAPLYSYGMSNDLIVQMAASPAIAATGLDVAKSGTNNILITWTNPSASDYWDIYAGTNKLAVKQPANLLGTVSTGTGSYTHVNGQNTGTTLYYLVIGRTSGGTESGYSTMGVKAHKAFVHNAYPNTNIMWITIPQNSVYDTASDIVMELEGALVGPGLDTKINVVGKWLPQSQASTALVYDDIFEEWTGDDFTIYPGDGIYLSITSDFAWVVCGVDTESQLNFTYNSPPRTNIMFFNLPATCSYAKASDIVMELEGALMGPGLNTKINAIGLWILFSQYSTTLVYDTDFEEWTGDDFAIAPGTGIYFSITSSFSWTPELITPVVP